MPGSRSCLSVSTNMMEITRFKFIVSTWSVENMPILKSEMRFRLISKIEVGRAEILQFLMIQAREGENTGPAEADYYIL